MHGARAVAILVGVLLAFIAAAAPSASAAPTAGTVPLRASVPGASATGSVTWIDAYTYSASFTVTDTVADGKSARAYYYYSSAIGYAPPFPQTTDGGKGTSKSGSAQNVSATAGKIPSMHLSVCRTKADRNVNEQCSTSGETYNPYR